MKILITAGPTIEPIDKVRFISNYSTGKMGYCIAEAARKKDHKVTLISGPTNLKKPKKVKFISIKTARELQQAVKKEFKKNDCLIMTAAVSDFRPLKIFKGKIKKEKQSPKSLKLAKNPDILVEIGKNKGNKILVGFALEDKNTIANAKKKLRQKNLDFIVANSVAEKSPFGDVRTSAVIIDKFGKIQRLRNTTKEKIAETIVNKIRHCERPRTK